MSYNCGCPITNEPTIPENYIKIFRGDDTDFNNSKFLKILLVTDIDLTGFKGIFNLLGFNYTGNVNATDKSLEIEIPASATSTFPIGHAQGVFRLEDTSNKLKTVSNTIPFYVTNHIFTDQPEEIILDVPPNYPISITLKVYDNGNGGDVKPPEPAGTSDYNELSNIPTFNGTPWKGDITFQGANIAPLSGLTALEDVVDEKASAVDVQNGLNGLQTQITTNKNDIGGLGDQVSEIEAKIPENASAENPLATISDITSTPTELPTASETQAGIVRLANLNETLQNSATNLAVNPKNLFEKLTGYPTREEMQNAIANAGGGDVDLSGYLPTTGGQMTGQIEFTEVNTEKNGLKFPGNGYLKHVGTVSGGNLETNKIFNSTAGLKSNGYRVLTEGDTINASQTRGLIPTSQKGVANGVAPLNASGKIDSQYLPEHTARTQVSDEKYGIRADYALTHGIIDCPNGLIDFSINTKEITINPGIILQLAGADTQTTLASSQTYTVQETGKITLFLARTSSTQIGFLEAASVYYQEQEPTNGTDAYLAWYNPNVGKWQFKSDDTGNVWREAVATPFANINAGATGITSINYIGYSVNDGRNCASLSDIESLEEKLALLMARVEALENK